MKSNIDFLIVGAGLYGATIANILQCAGYNCLIIDKRSHIAGNIYTEREYHDIDIHVYGPHIFHTDNDDVIDFVKQYATWNQYQQNTIATDGKKLYNLPFNCTTYCQIFGVTSPEEAYNIIQKEISEAKLKNSHNPQNLQEQAISMVGKTIYEKLIKNYTEKQWNTKCSNLSPEIIKRLPLRYTFDNNYFNDKFQGIPEEGYTQFVRNIIGNVPYILNIEFDYEYWKDKAKIIIYCGAVDELLDYELGELSWRSLSFENSTYQWNGHNGQGMPIQNLVGKQRGTRIIEHMWFRPHHVKLANPEDTKTSIVTLEVPQNWYKGLERYYAVNNKDTEVLYQKYCRRLKECMPNVILGGRLGKYRYFDMDDTILEAMNDANKLIEKQMIEYDRSVE